MNRQIKYIIGSLLLVSSSACSTIWSSAPESRTVVVEKYGSSLDAEPVPGTVVGPWAETMYQDVDVPGSIDKKGVYYRMPHKTVYEVRPEKYQRAQYPDEDGLYRERE